MFWARSNTETPGQYLRLFDAFHAQLIPRLAASRVYDATLSPMEDHTAVQPDTRPAYKSPRSTKRPLCTGHLYIENRIFRNEQSLVLTCVEAHRDRHVMPIHSNYHHFLLITNTCCADNEAINSWTNQITSPATAILRERRQLPTPYISFHTISPAPGLGCCRYRYLKCPRLTRLRPTHTPRNP